AFEMVHRRWLTNVKPFDSSIRHSFHHLHRPHVGERRSAPQASFEIFQRGSLTDRVRFHAPIIEVTHPPADTNFLRGPLREVAIADSLHASGNQVAARAHDFSMT